MSPDTPFLDVLDRVPPVGAPIVAVTAETPFVPVYFGHEEEAADDDVAAVAALFKDLHDRELDAAVAHLVDGAQARADRVLSSFGPAGRHRAEGAVAQWLRPLAAASEGALARLAQEVEAAETTHLGSMAEEQLVEVLGRGGDVGGTGVPEFEEFLGALVRKAKSVARTAVSMAKKGVAAVGRVLPVGMILRQLTRLVRPLLDRVLAMALDKLPPALRAPAAALARKVLGRGRQEAEAEVGELVPAAPDVATVQQELDQQVVGLLLGRQDPELLLAEVGEGAITPYNAVTDLDDARERLVVGLQSLEDGEDPTPLVEQFLPALLPVLRTALSVVGRGRVVDFLAKHLGRVISPLVGPTVTPPLSKAIVDAGLRLMTLEAPDEREVDGEAGPGIAAEALAFFLEDAATAVLTGVREDEIDMESLLEVAAMEAVDDAAEASFPAEVLGLTPPTRRGVWVPMPRSGPRRYRKLSRVTDVTLRPRALARVRTRSGRTLASVLGDRVGPSGVVQARVHVVEALPGATAGRIVRAEPAAEPVPKPAIEPAVGSAAGPAADAAAAAEPTADAAPAIDATASAAPDTATAQLLPLTREAAEVLLGEAGLGRDVDESLLAEDAPMVAGERLYLLEVRAAGRAPAGASSRWTARTDADRSTVVTLRLSEALAQQVALLARRPRPAGAVLRALACLWGPSLRPAGHGRATLGGAASSAALTEPVALVRRTLAARLEAQRQDLITAASAIEDGITVVVVAPFGARVGELTVRAGQHDG